MKKQSVCLSAERINAEKKVINNNQIKVKMKKNIMKAAFVAAIAMMSGINVFNAQKSETLSDIALVNVEALAGDVEETVKYKYVYLTQPGDPSYPNTRCVCSVKDKNGVSCC